MSDLDSDRWLIGYDIKCPKRLGRVYRYLSKNGVALQYSLFSLNASQERIEEILGEIRQRIDSDQDDIRAYHLTAHTKLWALGTHCIDQGVSVTDKTLLDLLSPQEFLA